MLDEMTVGQLQEWWIFNSLEPFWEERINDLFASVAQVLMNVNRDKKKRHKPFELKDARLYWGDDNQKKPTDWKLAGQQMRMMATMLKLKAESKTQQRRNRV
jgi:hypothetical protein